MARGQVQGGAIPTSINIWILGPIPPCPNPFQDRVSILRDASNGWASTSPNKLDGLCDPWVQAVVNGTTQCGRFQ